MEDNRLPPSTEPFEPSVPLSQGQKLKELAQVFLKLGTIAFGGPSVHIALMDDEVVKRRQWMSREKLLDLLGITNLIPGPNSTELAIHIGYERAGLQGLVIAGVCFILPATLIVWAIAAVYVEYQTLPQAAGLLYGIKPVIVAIVIQALWKLGQSALKDLPTIAAGVVVILCFFFKIHEILLLLGAGLSVMLVKNRSRIRANFALLLPVYGSLPVFEMAASPRPASVSGVNVFLLFLKIGSVLYGSGYTLLAFLQRDLVERSHWLTSQQLLDAVAVGQITPGPVFTTATFIGYLLAGNRGAIAGTLGIFLPAFIFVALVNPFVPKLRQSTWASSFLDGVNAASLGLMAVVTWQLGQISLVSLFTLALALLSLVAIFRFRVNSVWLVLTGGIVGLVAQALSLKI